MSVSRRSGKTCSGSTEQVSDHYFTGRMTFALLCILILWGMSAVILVVDVASLPMVGRYYPIEFLETHPEFWETLNISSQHYPSVVAPEDDGRGLEFNLGNHYVSRFENTLMYLGWIFGMMRFADLMLLFRRRDRELSFAFWFEHFD